MRSRAKRNKRGIGRMLGDQRRHEAKVKTAGQRRAAAKRVLTGIRFPATGRPVAEFDDGTTGTWPDDR